MTNEDAKYLKKYLSEITKENIEARIDMYKEFLYTLMVILINKGLKGNYLEELINLKNEYMWILSEEINLYKLIRKSIKFGDIAAIDILLNKINESIEKSILYYYKVIDDIEDEITCGLEREYRRPKKNFDTLTDSYEFRKEAVGLSVTIDDVKKFLNYPDEFWNYMKDKTHILPEPYIDYDIKMNFYGLWNEMDIDDNCVVKIISIPKIIDLKTAQIAIHEYKHAFDIYTNYPDLSKDIAEERAKEAEAIFKDQFIPLKKPRLFN